MAKRTRSQRRADRAGHQESGSATALVSGGKARSGGQTATRRGSPRARRERPQAGKPMALRIALGAIFVIALVLLLSTLRNR